MPVHAIRVETSELSNGTPLETVVRNLVHSLDRVLPDGEAEFREYEPTETEPLNENYRAGTWRFGGDYEAEWLVDRFEDAFRGRAKWYRIRYHLCTLDEPIEDRDPCPWNGGEIRLGGNVPDALPGPTDPADV